MDCEVSVAGKDTRSIDRNRECEAWKAWKGSLAKTDRRNCTNPSITRGQEEK